MKKNILIVEDDDLLRKDLSLIIEDQGFNVENAANGKIALKMLQTNDYSCVILDDNLPFIQGSELLNLIRMHNPHIKIIIMSGLFNSDRIKQMKDMGADLVIEKPFDFKIINECLGSID